MPKRKGKNKTTSLSSSADKLYDPSYKSNLILRPDGQASWDKKVWDWEPGKNLLKKKSFDDPVKPKKKYTKDTDKTARWDLPKTYCPNCRGNECKPSDKQNRGYWCFMEEYPGIQANRHDVALYWTCEECTREGIELRNPKIDMPYNQLILSRSKRIEEGIIDYIRHQILRGEDPLERRSV